MGFRINRAIIGIHNSNERKGQRDPQEDSSQRQQDSPKNDSPPPSSNDQETETISLRRLKSVIGRANEVLTTSQNKGLHYELKKIESDYFVILMSPENTEIRKLTLNDFLEYMGQTGASGGNRGHVFDKKY